MLNVYIWTHGLSDLSEGFGRVEQDDDRDQFARWRDAGIDPARPSMARVYDYWLGGTSNLTADRQLAEAMATRDPCIPAACKANRAFLGRAVRYLAGQGIRQFLDIGSGIPAGPNVHQIARQAAPGARVVYADTDPAAVADGRFMLADDDRATIIEADLREPEAILSHQETRRLIDFGEPVGIILAAVLHFILERHDPHAIVARLRDPAAPGSHLVISHAASDNAALVEITEKLYNDRAADGQARTRAEITRFFGDWDLAEPGLVWAPQWRPDAPDDVPADPERYWFLAGAARKRAPTCE